MSATINPIPTETRMGARDDDLMRVLNDVGVSRLAREIGISRNSLVRWTSIPAKRRADVEAARERVLRERASAPEAA